MRKLAWAALAAVVGVGLALGAASFVVQSRAGSSIPGIGGPFTLVDQRGRTVTDKDFRGKPSVMYFGFTYCPEVCPTTLAALTTWLKAIGPDADKLNVAFVTVDPARDTPKEMALYLTSFDRHIRGLTGTPAQIAQIAREYRVYINKVALPGGGYTMDHSSALYLMDRNGHLAGVIGYGESADRAEADLRKLVQG